jgi:ribosomal protein S18 acetylase RimI-like enzyme
MRQERKRGESVNMIECLRQSAYGRSFAYKPNPNDDIIGRFDLKEKDAKLEIWSLYITKQFQNQGHATRMLTEFLEKFKSDKILVLYVLHNNAIAIHLYEKMGFVIVGDYGDYAYEMQYMGVNQNENISYIKDA